MCDSVHVVPSLPQLCGRQRHCANVPAQSPSDYFSRTISIPVMDHLLSQMERRFDHHQKTALQCFYLVPSILVGKTLEEVTPTVQQLGDLYSRNLPFFSSLLQSTLRRTAPSENGSTTRARHSL